MPTLRLDAKLGLNKTGFDAGLREAARATDRFAKTIVSRLGSGLLAAFSVQKVVQFGDKIIEQGANIDRLSKKFNLTTDEVQLLQHEANRTGQTFNELVGDAEKLEETLSRLRGGEGVIFSRKQVEDLAHAKQVLQSFGDELKAQTAQAMSMDPDGPLARVAKMFLPLDLIRKFIGPKDDPRQAAPGADAFLEKDAAAKRAQQRVAEIVKETATIREQLQKRLLSDEEKLIELAKKREEIFARITRTAVERAQKEQDLAKNEVAIAQARESMDRKAGGADPMTGGFTPLQNPLGTIGAFTGGAASNTAAQQALMELRIIKTALIQKGILVRDTR